MSITTVNTTVKEFFDRKDEFMFPSNGDKFLHIRNARGDRRDEWVYTDVMYVTDNGKYKVSKEGGVAKVGMLSAHTKIIVIYEQKEREPRRLEKLEEFEELVARIAPNQPRTLAGRYT